MRSWLILLIVASFASAGCPPAEESPSESEGEESSEEGDEAESEDEGEAEAEEETDDETEDGSEEAAAEDTWEDNVFTSPSFNIRFRLDSTRWSQVEADSGDSGPAGLGTSDDSITFVGPADTGMRLVIGNSESIQLAETSFDNLTESIGFENVRIHPDASQQRTFNGVPGYRTEADALLRGDQVPVYLIAQALELPGQPTMATIFIPGDRYFEHSDEMKSILDSIEALNLRR